MTIRIGDKHRRKIEKGYENMVAPESKIIPRFLKTVF